MIYVYAGISSLWYIEHFLSHSAHAHSDNTRRESLHCETDTYLPTRFYTAYTIYVEMYISCKPMKERVLKEHSLFIHKKR